MKLVDITFFETEGLDRIREPIAFGVPVAQGLLANPDGLTLSAGEQTLPLDVRAIQHWPDGSVRWCLLDTQVDVKAGQPTVCTLATGDRPAPAAAVSVVDARAGSVFEVNTGVAGFKVKTDDLSCVAGGGSTGLQDVLLETPAGRHLSPTIETSQWSRHQGAARATLSQQGSYCDEGGEALCRFVSELTFHAGSARVSWQFTLHNPRAAEHPGGLWDLGDPQSLLFKGLQATVRLPEASRVQLQVEPEGHWLPVSQLLNVFQASSGGEHWDSRNHVDRTGKVNLPFKGYRLQVDNTEQSGSRAAPVLVADSGVALCIDRFWQNFPKALSFQAGAVGLHLFPAACAMEHELQPGEQKTHRLELDFAATMDSAPALRSGLVAHLAPEYVAASGCLAHFSCRPEPLDRLIAMGLDPKQGFLAKREIVDEYGWRNFGDIFADHESLYLAQGNLFVSHYNNQYDPLYGFLRQFLLTGDARWKRMADELAWHITDIDIYNTVQDRAEYNGGLFWHTDHYVDAYTSSHRTYSRHQKPNGRDVTQGGGPGAEHCYTHGLMLHYCLTGSTRSREAVLQLTQWITDFYEGTGTVVEVMLDARNRVLPKLKARGVDGRILSHRYPFNRGVGNFINGLLDSFALTGEKRFVQKAEQVISKTFSPQDNLSDRKLEEVEVAWFYTIFLQAVARYLETKKQLGEENTAQYAFSRQAFMKYATWIAQHDQPYLSEPDILEFPNDTWAAQDLRKAWILYYATMYAATEAEQKTLRDRADFFYHYVEQTLSNSETRHFSRILAILMQNHGVHGFFSAAEKPVPGADQAEDRVFPSPYKNTLQWALLPVRDLLSALWRFSLRKELHWLSHRSGMFARWYNRLYGR